MNELVRKWSFSFTSLHKAIEFVAPLELLFLFLCFELGFVGEGWCFQQNKPWYVRFSANADSVSLGIIVNKHFLKLLPCKCFGVVFIVNISNLEWNKWGTSVIFIYDDYYLVINIKENIGSYENN